jgi:hypothetical protein
MPASASRVLIALAISGVVVSGLAACAADTEAAPEATSGASAPTVTATPTPAATEAPEEGTPVTIGCDTLITPQEMYDYDPNFALSESYKPAAGTDSATIVADNGIACLWVQQTSGQVIEVAVANLPDEQLTHLKNDFVTNSMSVPTYGDPTKIEGYFLPGATDGDAGQVDVFSGPYWISIDSDAFVEPGDAVPIVDSALAGLGQ